jgi:hypothetical protein
MHRVDTDVLLASGYAMFLVFVAATLELLARHSHRRTQRIRTVGFSYHPNLDVWQCPTGKHLYRAEATKDSNVVRYRARAHQCNTCPIKNRCTDSDEGRVIELHTESWLQSELRKFHRGLSLTLLFLSGLILVLALLRQSNRLDQALLALLLLSITGVGLRLCPDSFAPQLRRHSEECD